MGNVGCLEFAAAEQMINPALDGGHNRRLPSIRPGVHVAIGETVAGAHIRVDGQEEVADW